MGMKLPGKFKMTVSGCNLNCAESWVRAGGQYSNALDSHPVVGFYRENAKKGERLGMMIERVGLEAVKQQVS